MIDKQILYRSDNMNPLGVVSPGYKIVQPGEIIDFYEDLVDTMGFQLHTAGSLKGGRIIWALAKTGKDFKIGRTKDELKGFLLLSTSNDKSMATRAQYTSVRVVCNNTLNLAIGRGKSGVSVTHAANFDHDKVKTELGLYDSAWSEFKQQANAMSKRKVKDTESLDYFCEVMRVSEKTNEEMAETRTIKTLQEMFAGQAIGSDMTSSKGTVWGMLNSVTEFLDHRRGNDMDARLVNAWFKKGARTKTLAMQEAIKLL